MTDTFDVVKAIILEVAGEEALLGDPVTRTTSFNKDLELESIDFVTLAEKLQQYFGADVNFADWLSSMDIDEIIALTVGDLVDYIDRCLSSKQTA